MSKLHILQRAGILLLLALLWAVIESISAFGAFRHETDPVRGAQMAALTVTCAALAFIAFGLAGRLKEDERPHVRARAKAARVVAVCLLFIGPIPFFGSALKAENQARAWAAYVDSPAYLSDQQVAMDPMADRFERQSARDRLIPPANANLDVLDAEFWLALTIQGLLIFASDALRVPAPITPEEAKHWRAVAAGKKAAITRKRNAAKRKQRKAFRLISGGKT